MEREARGEEFARYRDVDGDGICYRTLPGTAHAKAAFFTRGTGHTEKALYSEDAENFRASLVRLQKKMQTAVKFLPAPLMDKFDEKPPGQASKNITPANKPVSVTGAAKTLLIAYGSSDAAIAETRTELATKGLTTDYLRLRAWPIAPALEKTLANYDHIYIIEQNRDMQMRGLLTEKFYLHAAKFRSVLSFDGLPLSAEFITSEILDTHLVKAAITRGGAHA